jgi:hypothetical protein
MPDTRTQVRLLLRRAAELRMQGQEIQRKLLKVFAEFARLKSRQDGSAPDNEPASAQVWREGPNEIDPTDTPV